MGYCTNYIISVVCSLSSSMVQNHIICNTRRYCAPNLHAQRVVQLPEVCTPELCDRPSALLELKSGCSERRYSRQWCMATTRGARARATTTRCAEPTTASWLAASAGDITISPATRFPIWTRLSRRKVRASGRLYTGGESCSRDLWRAWGIRDYRSAWCSENWWGARAAWEPW